MQSAYQGIKQPMFKYALFVTAYLLATLQKCNLIFTNSEKSLLDLSFAVKLSSL